MKRRQLQPVVVKQDQGGFLLVAGERRFRAAKLAGLGSLSALVIEPEADPDELALIENLQRDDLEPLEEAEALTNLAKTHGYTQEQLASVVGRSRVAISESLKLLELPSC